MPTAHSGCSRILQISKGGQKKEEKLSPIVNG
jgi:hypothetical protein